MSEVTISSTGWLAISLRNNAACVFNLVDIEAWEFLQSKPVTNVVKEKQTVDEAEEGDMDNLNRNLIRFTPNGETLVVNGQNKQLFVYIRSDFEESQNWWQLQRTINLKKRASALDLTDQLMLIADKSGDVYKFDLSSNDQNSDVTLQSEDCIMGHLSMLLGVAFIRMNDKKEYVLTADRDEKIRLSHYPNAYNIESYGLGHTEFVSHIKLIDDTHFLSASGDGTLRLWHLPDCVSLAVLHSKAFTVSSKTVFYTELYTSIDNEDLESYQASAIPKEISLDSSSSIDHSIWKMDVLSYRSNVFIAFSLYAQRAHSIYLTTLSNMQQLANTQRKLVLDVNYGAIVDYCFSPKSRSLDTNDYLYILFDTNTLLKVNISSIFNCDKSEFIGKTNEIIQMINTTLATEELIRLNVYNNTASSDTIFKQLFKARSNPGTSSYYKRKTERIEQQEERKKKQMPSKSDNEVPV